MPKSNAKLAKKVLLKAIHAFNLGLVQYQVLLDKVSGGESRASLQQSFVTLKSASPRRAGTSRRA